MIEIDATYQNGVLKPDKPLPLPEQQRVRITVREKPSEARRGYGLVEWKGDLKDLDFLIHDAENDPLEKP